MRALNRPTLALLSLALGLAVAGPAGADDRDLLKESFGEPYVFILLDTSGSMNWSTRCTAEQLAAGDCRQLCEGRDCFVPLNADDPASKFYQAKEALYEVLGQVSDIRFGFATYNQDQLYLRAKHWLYRATAGGWDIPGWGPFPAAGAEEVFGYQWACDNGNGDERVGCNGSQPADLSDPWELTRVQRLPKGGAKFSDSRFFWIRHAGEIYAVRYRNAGGQLDDPVIQVEEDVWQCNDSSCSTYTYLGEAIVPFERISDFSSWDNRVSRTTPQDGYFDQWAASDSSAGATCGGWDPNDDQGADTRDGYNLRFPTTTHPTFSPDLDEGDVIPLSWEDNNKDAILKRLAPNTLLGEAVPDFRIARYFQDVPLAGEDFLRLENDAVRPLVANGSTPLGYSLVDFREWWAGCPQGSCPNRTGWADLAAEEDPDWACRKKYLLVISDGDDTCNGPDPCSNTAALFAQEAVKTYVVAYGVENTPHNKLVCMASNGGTGEPIFPQNRQELVDALTQIFGEIKEEARAFASAAVPSVQAEVEDKIYLSSFTPLNNESTWDGHLDAYLKPLPLAADGKPDESRDCASLPVGDRSSCHLWDAGVSLLTQAPDDADILAGSLKLGSGENERRIFFPRAQDLVTHAQPPKRALFRTPDHDAFSDPFSDLVTETQAWADLFDGLGLIYTVADLSTDDSPPKIISRRVVEDTLVIKNSVIDNQDGTTTPITYLLGDIFHSNPNVVDRPADFRSFAGNYYNDNTNDPGGISCPDSNPGYRCFAKKHQRRRKMLAVGANDGQLHLFDSGIFNTTTDRFSNGTGKELMSLIPRLVLPIVRDTAQGAAQVYSVDSTPRVVDVFIDPAQPNGQPNVDEREWRTVAITGLREGSSRNGGGRTQLNNGKPWTSGYFAVDLTQPDRLNSDNEPVNQNLVPTCLTSYDPNECGPVRFGDELWEFTDSIDGSPAEWGTAFDEDQNSYPDLGDTWSVPVIGRIRVLDASGNSEDRFVAIFGGGYDPENRASPQSGNWLFMVDVETGDAIYKRQLDGAAASNPAAVDRNRDGYIDWIYVGTSTGFLYKVDVSVPAELTPVDVHLLGTSSTVQVERVVDPAWEPFKIFNASADGNRRPLFFPPTVLNVSEINRFALAFGTGDREQLWSFGGTEGRFYVIVDENFTRDQEISGVLPKDDTDYNVFDSESATNQGTDFVINPPSGRDRGWVMTLDPDERVVAQAFSVAGVTIFPTFQPQVVVTDDGSGGRDDSAICARTGDSRVFVIFSNNGDPILPSETGGATPDNRSMTVGEALVTPPFADQSATKNPSTGEPSNPDQEAWQEAIKETLKDLFPPGTRFANYTIDVSFIRSDTGLVGPIPIPIGILEKNWKSF